MENLDSYHNIIQKILNQYYQLATHRADLSNDSEVSDRLALDEHQGQYLWFRFGWDDKQFVQYIIMDTLH
ncbi:XisI protein [Zarconia navalis]|uniref:XisI protein n=1 Tax=Zarconia navalis TaxID=2992134 RepID=UPI0021F86545|nr:XisI protein [Zarconia navalis]